MTCKWDFWTLDNYIISVKQSSSFYSRHAITSFTYSLPISSVSMFNFWSWVRKKRQRKEEDKKNFDRLRLQQSSGWIYDNNRIHKRMYINCHLLLLSKEHGCEKLAENSCSCAVPRLKSSTFFLSSGAFSCLFALIEEYPAQ